jgi:hypothetical protein
VLQGRERYRQVLEQRLAWEVREGEKRVVHLLQQRHSLPIQEEQREQPQGRWLVQEQPEHREGWNQLVVLEQQEHQQ